MDTILTASGQNASIHLLIVDDSDTDAEIVEFTLSEPNLRKRYTCSRAIDVAATLKHLETDQFDIILLDLGLPDSEGLESVQRIMSQANCPIVVLSGQDDENIAIQAVQGGAQDYLIKDELTTRTLDKALLYSIERYALKRKLETAMEKAEAASRAKSDFLAVMSHEFRTPMNGIVGNLNLLRSLTLPAEAEELLETMQVCADSQIELIGDLLDISRIEAGKLPIEVQDFEVHDLIQSAIKIMNFKAKSKGLELLICIDPNIPQVFTSDQHRLRQVLINLIGNAIKFTDKGEVRLKVQRTSPNELFFSIRDTGVGIEPDKLHAIFDAFTQADSSYERRYQGSGLGLTICKRLVEMMGGNIGVDSTPNAGSVFSFSLPSLKESSHPQNEASPQQTQAEDANLDIPLSILLVEDDALSRNFIVSTLQYLGHDPTIANDGIDGLEKAKTTLFDLILIDLRMPALDGFETAKRIRQISTLATRRPYIAAVTACDSNEDRSRCLLSGMDDFIAKPVDIKELTRVLNDARSRALELRKRNSPPPSSARQKKRSASNANLRYWPTST